VVAFATLLCALALTCGSAHAGTPLRGVMLHSLWWEVDSATMDRELDLSAQAGATTVRVDVSWANIEWAGKGTATDWYVTKLDRFVAGAEARGMKVIANLWATPCWASTAPDDIKQGCGDEGAYWRGGGATYPPANPADYGDIARWVTERYGTKLAAVEIWNEPDHPDHAFFKADDVAGAYAALVKAAYPQAKAGNAGVAVLAGAMVGSDLPFLQALYANGIRGSYDGISVHAYADVGFAKLDNFRAAQVAAGDSAPIWITEFGWPTGNASQWHVSEGEQGAQIRRGFADADQRPWVAAALIYGLRDKGDNRDSMEDNFGVLHHDFTPKASFAALSAGLHGTPLSTPRSTPAAAGPAVTKPAIKRGTRVRLWLRVRHGRVTVFGRGPVGRKVALTVRTHSRRGKVRARQTRSRIVRVDRRGRFHATLGSRKRLRGLTVRGRVL
jgi:hypothetical protein